MTQGAIFRFLASRLYDEGPRASLLDMTESVLHSLYNDFLGNSQTQLDPDSCPHENMDP